MISRRLKARIDQLERAIIPPPPPRVFMMPPYSDPTPAEIKAFEVANGVRDRDVLLIGDNVEVLADIAQIALEVANFDF